MRLHDDEPDAMPGTYGERERAVATPASLSLVRFELITRENVARGRIEITFARDDVRVTIAGAYVDLALLAGGTPAALTFPRAAARLFDEPGAAAVADALIPHLRLLIRARTVPLEATIRFDASPQTEISGRSGPGGDGATPTCSADDDASRRARPSDRRPEPESQTERTPNQG